MMIRKMAAVLTAAAITATGAAYSGCLNSFTTTYAAEASAEKAETCGVKVSVIAPNHKLPEGITAKLVSVKGEEKTEIASWDASAVKEIKDLEYSADADYRITFDGAPEDFFLPEETKVELAGKGSVDKIVICGFSRYAYPGFLFSIDNGEELNFNRRIISMSNTLSSISGAYSKDIIEEAWIKDDEGNRYVNAASEVNSGFIVPDGHYTAFVKPAEGYRFVQKYSGTAKKICDLEKISINYFDRDLSNGVEFNVVNGYADTVLDFFVEKIPTEENSCSAKISVVDADTGELLKGCTVELDESFAKELQVLRWRTSDSNPLTIDALYETDDEYEFKVINSPAGYEPSNSCEIEFENIGEHKEGVIKLKRTMTDKELKALKKVELPAEDPVPDDSAHCAVTVGVFDYKTGAAITEGTATLYEYPNGERKDSVELASWDINEEPVKSVTDIEYHDNSLYVVNIDADVACNNDGKVYLSLKKGGDTDKIAVPLYPSSVYGNVTASVDLCHSDESMSQISGATVFNKQENALSSAGVYDDKGYRYFFTSAMDREQLGKGALPDGEYTLRAVPAEGYRILTMGSEVSAMSMLNERYPYDIIAANEENGKNGLRFTVKDGIADVRPVLLVEAAPTEEKSCSADISIVDEDTGEIITGIGAELRGRNIPNGFLKWNTTDTPVKTFDNLFRKGREYQVVIFSPSEYHDLYTTQTFSFTEFGEHKDVVIKLKNGAPAATEPAATTATTAAETKPAATTATTAAETKPAATTADETQVPVETTPAGNLGDINGDGMIDSNDASVVLEDYAKASTGGESDIDKTVGDINGDGIVDSNDASIILAYYAAVSTGKDIKLEDFLTEE